MMTAVSIVTITIDFIDQTIRKFSFNNQGSVILIEYGLEESPRLCSRELQNRKYGSYLHLEKHISFGS